MKPLTVLAAAPVTGPDTVAAVSVVQLNWSGDIEVQLHAVNAAVTVRPWYWSAGRWHALGGDGLAALGGVTADPAKYGGTAEGRFQGPGFGAYWVLVAESGAAANIDEAYIGEVPGSIST